MSLRRSTALVAVVLLAAGGATTAGCGRRGGTAERDDNSVAASVDTAFYADGAIATFGDTAGEARSLAAIVTARTPGGVRVVLTFADAEGLPANTVGPGRVEMRRDLGVLRVWLPREVDSGATTGRFFAGELVSDAYLVRSLAGPCFVDLHLRGGAVARVWEHDLPVAIVIELRPGGGPVTPPVARGVVLLAPRAGPVSYPIELTGYGRTFEATVSARLLRDGHVVRDTFTTAADYLDMWGEFRFAIPDGPSGPLELQVGDVDAEDGHWNGVSVPVEVK